MQKIKCDAKTNCVNVSREHNLPKGKPNGNMKSTVALGVRDTRRKTQANCSVWQSCRWSRYGIRPRATDVRSIVDIAAKRKFVSQIYDQQHCTLYRRSAFFTCAQQNSTKCQSIIDLGFYRLRSIFHSLRSLFCYNCGGIENRLEVLKFYTIAYLLSPQISAEEFRRVRSQAICQTDQYLL